MKTSFRSLLVVLAASRWILCPGAESPARAAELKPVDYMVLVTGGELLEGAYPDAHTHFITRTLRELGCRCVGSMTVDDDREAIEQALRFATHRAPLILLTGGLGPTPNDITRETLSEFTGIPLREHPEVIEEMERRFRQTRDQLRPTLRRQALVPARGGFLKNTAGTAVGLIFDSAPAMIVALPGPPRELQPMVKNELVPYLQGRFGVREFGSSLTLRFVGAGQSLIAQTIKDHVSVAPDVTITSLFEEGRVDFTFSLPGHGVADQARLRQLSASIREHLAEYIYAEDRSSLEEVVAQRIRATGGTLVIVEIGTGGRLAASLSGIKDSSRVLAGAYAAPNEDALARLMQIPAGERVRTGEDPSVTLGAAAATRTQSSWAISVGRVESEASGGRHLKVALKLPGENWSVQRVAVRESEEISVPHLTTQILDLIRKRIH